VSTDQRKLFTYFSCNR